MLTNNKNLKGLVLRATDGEIGTVEELYFDDQVWAVRYLTAETGSWLNGRKVLISPRSIQRVDWLTSRIDLSLTRNQIENAPNIDTHQPVSRQHEAEFLGYYAYPNYWDEPMLLADRLRKASADSHLRTTAAVEGYHVDAMDGDIGHIDRFIVDDETWSIRYLEVATKNWWPGKKVLLSSSWVERVSWEGSKVFVGVTREAIETCPEYVDGTRITREYENKLYFHYGRPPYWIEEQERDAAFALTAR
jgi:hypothetical protein